MKAPQRDTQWGPMEAYFQATRDAAQSLEGAGFAVELNMPNLPIYAEEGEAKRLAKKAKEEDAEHEWRGDAFILLKDRSRLLAALMHLRDECGYEQCMDVTAVDFDAEDENLWGMYALLSLQHKLRLSLKIYIPKSDPVVDSATSVYPAANWHERESSEFYGIEYRGHPDPRNMLLPDDWVGHPLRKDYEFPEEYNGVSCV